MSEWIATFDKYSQPIDNYIGEVYIEPNKIANAVKASLGKKKITDFQLMYYFGNRDNIPKRLQILFGYIKGKPTVRPGKKE